MNVHYFILLKKKKTIYFLITFNNTRLAQKYNIKELGVLLDTKLFFNNHVYYVI